MGWRLVADPGSLIGGYILYILVCRYMVYTIIQLYMTVRRDKRSFLGPCFPGSALSVVCM